VYFQFEKPGRRENFDYPDMTLEAGVVLCFSEFSELLTVSDLFVVTTLVRAYVLS